MGGLKYRLSDQSGTALMLAIMMLAALTLLGMAITGTGLVEIDIARNEKTHEMAFYKAEGGWQYGVSWLDIHPFGVVDDYGSTAQPAIFADAFSTAQAANPQMVEEGGEELGFAVEIDFRNATHPPLWGKDFSRANYSVVAVGAGPNGALSRIEARPGKIYHSEGY